MNPLFKLLEDKNYWYGKYLNSNEAFLQALKHAPEVALDELELFYGNRESLLKILEKLDKKIQVELAKPLWQAGVSEEVKKQVEGYISEKDSLIGKIVGLDTQILDTMEAIRSAGLEKLKLLAKGKKALANYRSSFNYNEKIDKRI
jgi:hypothetical protein